jgi:site-specific DNA-cytosine methylase
MQKRRSEHGDHALLERYFSHVHEIRPWIFLMENVPALGSDASYLTETGRLRTAGYDVRSEIVRYNEYGAYTTRRRLFTVGIRGSRIGAKAFFRHLAAHRQPERTVREAIEWLRDKARGEVADHDWSLLNTIGKYRGHYESGKYGWKRLDYDEPAPSFGSVAKTYILHPEAGVGTFPERVLSVREVMAIAGFDTSVAFPIGTPRAKRYQMVANTVSPSVSRALAAVVRIFLVGNDRASHP